MLMPGATPFSRRDAAAAAQQFRAPGPRRMRRGTIDAPPVRAVDSAALKPPAARDDTRKAPGPAVSVVVPVRNEAGNVAPLVAEIAAALEGRWTLRGRST